MDNYKRMQTTNKSSLSNINFKVPLRAIKKIYFIMRRIVAIRSHVTYLACKIRFSGASIIGNTSTGNIILSLNKNYLLGERGTILQLPQDQVIFKKIRYYGNWEIEESKFLGRTLKELSSISRRKTAFFDIGANTGLVTLQAMNFSAANNDVYLFEPVPRHIIAIKNNLKKLMKTVQIEINEFALGAGNGISTIYTEDLNHGNTSLYRSGVPQVRHIETSIELVSTEEYFANFTNKYTSYVIKSDTQGMDALILSRIPKNIWSAVESALVEVWALPEVDENDVKKLMEIWKNFEHISWNPDFQKEVHFDEIENFWLSKSSKAKNLFLTKNIY